MGCTFCSTGTMGLKGDLTAGEIVEQLVHARKHVSAIRNIVFMVSQARLLECLIHLVQFTLQLSIRDQY